MAKVVVFFFCELTFDQVSKQGEVEIRFERESQTGVELLELPFERFASFHDDLFQRLLLVRGGVLEAIEHMIESVEILFQSSQAGCVELRLFQLKNGQGDPEDEFVDLRLDGEERKKTGERHDQRVDQIDVRERFQGLDENSQQSFHLAIAGRLRNASVVDDRSRLQGRIELKGESFGQFLPLGHQPSAVGDGIDTRFHQFQQRVADRL